MFHYLKSQIEEMAIRKLKLKDNSVFWEFISEIQKIYCNKSYNRSQKTMKNL